MVNLVQSKHLLTEVQQDPPDDPCDMQTSGLLPESLGSRDPFGVQWVEYGTSQYTRPLELSQQTSEKKQSYKDPADHLLWAWEYNRRLQVLYRNHTQCQIPWVDEVKLMKESSLSQSSYYEHQGKRKPPPAQTQGRRCALHQHQQLGQVLAEEVTHCNSEQNHNQWGRNEEGADGNTHRWQKHHKEPEKKEKHKIIVKGVAHLTFIQQKSD